MNREQRHLTDSNTLTVITVITVTLGDHKSLAVQPAA
jgi:hypothetical protein